MARSESWQRFTSTAVPIGVAAAILYVTWLWADGIVPVLIIATAMAVVWWIYESSVEGGVPESLRRRSQ